MSELQKFEDADIWRDSIQLSKDVYILSSGFPSSEQFGLTSQIRRAVNSVSANFAEGFGRYSKRDKHHFYTIAYGSLLEVKNFLYLSVELDFCNENKVTEMITEIELLQVQFNKLKKTLRS